MGHEKIGGMAVFLITGCPRSGTGYALEVMRAAGDVVGEENYNGKDDLCGVVSWKHIALMPEKFDLIYHQVREPLWVISSMTTMAEVNFKLMERYVGRIIYKNKFHRCMWLWLKWNELIEKADIKQGWKVEEFTERFVIAKGFNNWKNIPNNINSRKGKYKLRPLNFLKKTDKELTDKIIRKGKEYGYYADL